LTNYSAISVPTKSHGTVEVWEEVAPQNGWTSIPTGIWAAKALDSRGRTQMGYGKNTAEAIVSVLEGVGIANVDEPSISTPAPGRTYADQPTRRPYDLVDLFGGRGYYPGEGEPANPVRKELPQSFWIQINTGNKIVATKMLRDETGLTLKSAKDIVDRLMEKKAPKFEGTVLRGSAAMTAPVGTIIRINGKLGRYAYAGYVFEKMAADDWKTTGVEGPSTNADVQGAINDRGYELVYVPEAK
jgi:hypothetical protein